MVHPTLLPTGWSRLLADVSWTFSDRYLLRPIHSQFNMKAFQSSHVVQSFACTSKSVLFWLPLLRPPLNSSQLQHPWPSQLTVNVIQPAAVGRADVHALPDPSLVNEILKTGSYPADLFVWTPNVKAWILNGFYMVDHKSQIAHPQVYPTVWSSPWTGSLYTLNTERKSFPAPTFPSSGVQLKATPTPL